MKKTIVLFLFATIALNGCRKQISDYERPDFDPQPTLCAILSEGQPVWAQVSLAQGLDSVHPAPCDDAEVLLYVDGQFAERLSYGGEGFYFGETNAETLHEYAYKVVVPGFDTHFAQTQMPERPVVTQVEIMEKATVDDEGRQRPAILVTFSTDPGTKEYYQMNIDAFFENDYGTSYTNTQGTITSSANTDDPVLLNEGSDLLLFSNEIITDTAYTLKVNASFTSYSSGGHPSGLAYTTSGYAVVRMHGLSESAYRYLRSQAAFEEPDAYTNLFLGTITPLNVYSNVENGRGVMAAIAPMTCDTVFLNPEN